MKVIGLIVILTGLVMTACSDEAGPQGDLAASDAAGESAGSDVLGASGC